MPSLLLASLLGVLPACTAVAPWERGNLAKPQMEAQPPASQRAILEHIHRSREATSSSGSTQGGGCGCY
jgi:hypothetical protein